MVSAAIAAVAGGIVWAGGVLGGGVLAWVSYWAIRSSVDALVAATAGAGSPERRPSMGRSLLWLVGRHALLAAVAYVIIARLRLHPVGLLIGASAVVVAAAREAVRGVR